MATSRSTSRAPRVPPDEARQRLIDATIELLRTRDPMNVTVRDITAAAGLNMVHITRYFGSRAELLFAVSEELNERLIARARQEAADAPIRILGLEEIDMRLRVVMALRSEGFDMTRFQDAERRIFAEFAQFLVRVRGLAPTVAEIHAVKILLIIQAMNLMREANGIPDDDIAKMIALVFDEMLHHEDAARRLGWI